MLHVILAFLPLTVLIVSALITRKMAEPMIGSTLLALLILHKQNILSGTIESIYGALTNSSYQFVILILLGFGGMIKAFQESGSLVGFGNWISRYASGPRKPLILGWLMGFVMFADDYLCTMTTTISLRETTDRNGIPREHLAYQTNSEASCICVLIPFSSWTAFTIGLLSEYDLNFGDYVRAIPFMFYPILMVALCLLVALGLFPRIGVLKEAYKRVEQGGSTESGEELGQSLVSLDSSGDYEPSSPVNLILPLVVMIIGVMIFDKDLIHGMYLAIFCQFILYVGQRRLTVAEFFEDFFEGARSMIALLIVVCFGFMLTAANEQLGLFDILIGSVGKAMPVWMLPAVVFVLAGFTTFATSGCWLMQIISIPIFMPLAMAGGLPLIYVVAPLMSGVTLGYGTCFYADSMFMTAAGTGVSNLRIVHTTMPYALLVSAVALAGYLLLGVLGTA